MSAVINHVYVYKCREKFDRDYSIFTQFVFHLSCLFQGFLVQSLIILKISNFFLHLFYILFLAMQPYSYACTIENIPAQAG